MNFFWGVYSFWGRGGGGVITKLEYFLYSFMYSFFVGGGGAKISTMLWVCPIFLILFLVNSACWVQTYVARKN